MSGDFENTRKLLEKSEQQIRKARLDREREQCAADREQRERLERASPSGSRRSLIDILNAGAAPDMDVVTRLRALQKLTAENHNLEHTRYLAKAASDGEPFDRLSPSSRLGRSRSLPRLPDGSYDLGKARGSQEPDVAGDDPAYNERYVTPLRAERMESRGGVRGDDAGRRHFAVGEPEEIVARWLLEEAKRLIEHAKSRRVGLGYPK